MRNPWKKNLQKHQGKHLIQLCAKLGFKQEVTMLPRRMYYSIPLSKFPTLNTSPKIPIYCYLRSYTEDNSKHSEARI